MYFSEAISLEITVKPVPPAICFPHCHFTFIQYFTPFWIPATDASPMQCHICTTINFTATDKNLK